MPITKQSNSFFKFLGTYTGDPVEYAISPRSVSYLGSQGASPEVTRIITQTPVVDMSQPGPASSYVAMIQSAYPDPSADQQLPLFVGPLADLESGQHYFNWGNVTGYVEHDGFLFVSILGINGDEMVAIEGATKLQFEALIQKAVSDSPW